MRNQIFQKGGDGAWKNKVKGEDVIHIKAFLRGSLSSEKNEDEEDGEEGRS